MIPLSDSGGAPSHTTPWVTISFIAVNAVAFLYTVFLDPQDSQIFLFRFGVVPLEFTQPDLFRLRVESVQEFDVTPLVPSWATLITSMFLHGGWMHILGNMLFLWVFGDNLEHHFGRAGFIAFYLICGVLASGAHILFNQDSLIPAVGASGAIAGVLGAYLLLFPRRRVRTLFMVGLITVMEVPAVWMLAIWAAIQIFSGIISIGAIAPGGGVAYWAHVGGFAAGVGIVAGWRIHRREPVWQPDRYEAHTPHPSYYDDDDDDDYPSIPPGHTPRWRS